MHTVYGEVYIKNPKLQGRELLKAIEIYYNKKRKQKRFARVPMALVKDDLAVSGQLYFESWRQCICHAGQSSASATTTAG
jgi:hypothetical protein